MCCEMLSISLLKAPDFTNCGLYHKTKRLWQVPGARWRIRSSECSRRTPPKGMLSYCACAQEAASTKKQKEIWLVSGLKDHRYLSVTRMRHEDAGGLTTDRKETMNMQRYVKNQR